MNMKTKLCTLLFVIATSTMALSASSQARYDVAADQFTFVSKQDGSTVGLALLSANQTLQYSLDGIIWSNMTTITNFNLNNGDSLYVRGKLAGNNTETDYTQFTITGSVEAKGNINYLWDYDNLDAPLKECCGFRLFQECVGLNDVSHIELPATTLSNLCYRDLFYGCSNITSAPELPATTLADECYRGMFLNCSNLSASPTLPATHLKKSCYQDMFVRCYNLSTVPELPAIVLADSCYKDMFNSCTSIQNAPALPATKMENNCYRSMFKDCSSLTNAPILSATELADYCYQEMFVRCSSMQTAQQTLPAINLTEGCYWSMYHSCSSLTSAPSLPATALTESCYLCMFKNCTSLTTAPVLPASVLTPRCYVQMFWGCSNLTYIKCLATDISADACTEDWVRGITSSGTFVKHQNISSWGTGRSGIPSGWSVSSVMPYQIFFDANGGLIPLDGLMRNTPAQQASGLAPDQQTGWVFVYSGEGKFNRLVEDCPTREGYTFLGWYTDPNNGEQVYDNNGINIVGTYWSNTSKWQGSSNLQLYAHWQPNNYTIVWLQDNGTFIDFTIVPYGEIPTHANPTKDPTDEYTYTFAGWSPEVVAVTGDAT